MALMMRKMAFNSIVCLDDKGRDPIWAFAEPALPSS